MPSVQKISRNTLKGLLKQKQQEMRAAQAAAAEARLKRMIKSTAKSVFPYGNLYLQVGNECDVFVAKNCAREYHSRLDFSDSVWAPWSKCYKKNNFFK